MIELSRLNKQKFFLNDDLIEYIDEKPDTTISMVSGRRFIVSESADEVRRRIVAFRREIAVNLPSAHDDSIELLD